MRRYDVITEICDAMMALGWKPYQNDHEDANGQFEMNWEYDAALRTADRHAFFKYMVKSIAEKHGLRATFMPKPFAQPDRQRLPRARVAVVEGRQEPVRGCERRARPLRVGYHFIGGVMHSAEALCAITNPTVNSYKRINAPPTLSGATWSPNTVTYAGNNRTHMIRIPDRRPLRAPPRRRRGQSVSAAGGDPGRRARRHQQQARSRQAARHQHVHRRPQGEGRQEAAAQPARCAARAGEVVRVEGGPRRGRSSRPTSSSSTTTGTPIRAISPNGSGSRRRSIAEHALLGPRACLERAHRPHALGARVARRGAARELRRRRRSAAAGTGSPRPTIWRRSTASPTSRSSRRAGSAPAMPGATPRSSAPTICCPATSRSTNGR